MNYPNVLTLLCCEIEFWIGSISLEYELNSKVCVFVFLDPGVTLILVLKASWRWGFCCRKTENWLQNPFC